MWKIDMSEIAHELSQETIDKFCWSLLYEDFPTEECANNAVDNHELDGVFFDVWCDEEHGN